MLPVFFDEDDQFVPSEGRTSAYEAVAFAVPAAIITLGSYIAYRLITMPTIVDPMPPRPGPPLPPERDPLADVRAPGRAPLPKSFKPPPIARKESAPKFSASPPDFGRAAGGVPSAGDLDDDAEDGDEPEEGDDDDLEMPGEP